MAELPQLDRSLAAPFENARTLVLRRRGWMAVTGRQRPTLGKMETGPRPTDFRSALLRRSGECPLSIAAQQF